MNRLDELMLEKDNIEVAHKDLINDFSFLKHDREIAIIKNKTMQKEIDELTNQVSHLKQ